jgi:hypothetical protein
VRYEDMILRPAETVKALLDYLELDDSAERVRAMTETVGYTPPEMAEHLTAADISASIGRWRQDLSADVPRACHEDFEEALATFGYTAER